MSLTTHANRGKQWEATLSAFHAHYARKGDAYIIQTTPPAQRTKDGFRSIDVGAPDFVGVALGRPVLFEAKEARVRWGFTNLVKRAKRQAQTDSAHQAHALEQWQAAGGISFVALRLGGDYGRSWVVPWRVLSPLWWTWWRTRKQRGAKPRASIDVAWCSEHAWPMARDGWIGWVREQEVVSGTI